VPARPPAQALRSLARRAQLHPRAPRFREPDGDGLLGGPRPVLALADVVHLLAHELARLRGWRLAFPGVLVGPLQRLLFGHDGCLLREGCDLPADLAWTAPSNSGLCGPKQSPGRPAVHMIG